MKRAIHDGASARRGLALLTVLLVLLALLVLCAPFLMTARNASKASSQLADRVQSRLALDSAERHARASLGGSHPSVDTTPYYDGADELAVDNDLPPEFLDARDANGVMWDLDARDVASWIDLNSAPPQLFANILGTSTRLTAAVKATDDTLSVSSTSGFPPVGFLWVGRELIGYAKLDRQSFSGLTRGIGSASDGDGKALPCGPQPGSAHPAGQPVLDQRAFAPAEWRIRSKDGKVRQFDAPEHVRESSSLALGGIDGAALESIAKVGTVYAGVCAGHEWQRPVRLASSLQGGTTCVLVTDERRWFNPGTTVQVSDGTTTELAMVEEVLDRGFRLMQPLVNDYEAYTAEVRVLARRPINVNVAPAEVLELVFLNLQLRGVNSRITRDEARSLAAAVVESRPFTGFEDFLRRFVLPAAGLEPPPKNGHVASSLAGGAGLIDATDAVALYTNALNANDGTLAYSTVPLSFSSRDVYDLELRASVNAASGVERVSLVRDQVEMIVPQQDLLHVWARQQDFDDAFRLDLESPWWSTGPSATTRWDDGASPPSRLWAELGTYADRVYLPGVTPAVEGADPSSPPRPEHVFASREDDAWTQLWAARVDEAGVRLGRVMHFDHETRDPEGRYLPDQVVQESTASKIVDWTSASEPMLRPLDLSLWIKPRALADGLFLDVGRTSIESDRVSLGIEGPDLVLRVLDGAGDHPLTPELIEAGEARFAIAPGTGPGLAADTWSHVSIDVRGTRPDQITMLVDGRSFGVRTPGMTRLASTLTDTSSTIAVEDGEGFPNQGTLRIGDELIEYVKQGKNQFEAQFTTSGANAGFGGRLARIAFEGIEPGTPAALSVNTTHQAGTPVYLYGYSANLTSNIPNGTATLPQALGRFAVAIVEKVEPNPEDIVLQAGDSLGRGFEGNTSKMSGLDLKVADPAMSDHDMMAAFDPSGGYAVVMQRVNTWSIPNPTDPNGSKQQLSAITKNGSPVANFEVIRYTGFQGTTLQVAERGVNVKNTGQGGQVGRHAFVVFYDPGWVRSTLTADVPLKDLLEEKVFVAPISISAPGSGGLTSFLVHGGHSEFAQITHRDQAELTEWIRYDEILNSKLVRNEYEGLARAQFAAAHGIGSAERAGLPGPPPGPGGGGTPGGGNSGNKPKGPMDMLELAAPVSAPEPAPVAQTGTYLWQPLVFSSKDPNESTYPISQAVRTALQFRGVFGTYPQVHAAGTTILPVWRVEAGDPNEGHPGKNDTIFLMSDEPSDPGWPVRVHRAYQPLQYTYTTWSENIATPGTAVLGPSAAINEDPSILGLFSVHVALDDVAPVPIAMTPVATGAVAVESRLLSRVMMHPSGELPRVVDKVFVGGSIRGGLIPSATADEIVFGSTKFAEKTAAGGAARGASFLLGDVGLGQGAATCKVNPESLRLPSGLYSESTNFLSLLAKDAGLLRIGAEILAYDSYDEGTGVITIASGGRGLLGTKEETHEPGETVTYLSQFTVSVLSSGISAGDATLPLEDAEEFPPQGGTVLVDDELIHYTRLVLDQLDMPRASSEPGKMDHKADGLFRGRFGTTPAGHGSGTPVILFPFRYWDRQAERADGPELAYFGLSLDQPNAFWRSMFWEDEEPSVGGSQLIVMQRLDKGPRERAPWDGDPESTPGLKLFEQGLREGKPNPIGDQADRIEWRVFVRYLPGAFDAVAGLSHGWKETPRLKRFAVEYLGPNQVLRRVEQ